MTVKGVNDLRTMFAMGCITALGCIQLALYGDGSVLMACVSAISALAGVHVGVAITKKEK